ncbi:MAG: PQQ-binding-like beta-propeller repeat protein [Actinomycetota bacterium]|nr:PQQ-binding-like beta-propeller repeat protein [Actinomycetota bacterium]
MKFWPLAFVACLGMGGLVTASPSIATTRAPSAIGAWDWPTYGHDAQHTFHGRTTLTARTASTLARAWFFPTGLAVTATPTVVAGTVYVGSWDGYLYAIAFHAGKLRWKYRLAAQPAVSPQPGGPPDLGSDGGIVTSSAWFEPGNVAHPDLVLFGGGYTLYALDATTGNLFWKHDYTGRPDLPADPVHDDARIFSSPVVVDDKAVVGLSVDGRRGRRGYIVAADVQTGEPVWTRETDVDASGTVLNDGCGSVWSSGTVLPALGLVVFDVADCHGSNSGLLTEGVVALRIVDGTIAWLFQPPRRNDGCDMDFGATANAGVSDRGVARFLGVGGKDGTYYSLDPATGAVRWNTNVVFGGSAGGFIATSAYDGRRVYGSTALGDFDGPCAPGDPRDTQFQDPTVHVFAARTGKVVFQDSGSASFGPTTVARGLTFNCPALKAVLNVRTTTTGAKVAQVELPALCWSGVATVGDALVLGTGASFSSSGTGVLVLTPGGAQPSVPAGRAES